MMKEEAGMGDVKRQAEKKPKATALRRKGDREQKEKHMDAYCTAGLGVSLTTHIYQVGTVTCSF